ncbi:hypothetical protein AHMF7605_00115 [Adhaeribacter arboris]|uniref:Uncharacterized protein n=1 Tax=Adhaeribacter arboris TaxID=2072846 RepID=A0A2T2Y952_9BACT|nr:hypothetical protein [Adhaeribacter arboris]PSR52033.1 hypothetical protein AHMF7605_00115 [Adhaeribacter arboris]
MTQRIISLCYRKIVDSGATKPWDKLVFEDSYTEFKMQAQFYNQEKKYCTFAELVQQVPGAEKLHFLVSAAVTGYLQQLNEIVPDIINNLGKHFLKFTKFQFEIINSDLQNKSKHQIAFNFYSEPLIWHETIDNYLLVSDKNSGSDKAFPHLFRMQPYLSIYSLQTEN